MDRSFRPKMPFPIRTLRSVNTNVLRLRQKPYSPSVKAYLTNKAARVGRATKTTRSPCWRSTRGTDRGDRPAIFVCRMTPSVRFLWDVLPTDVTHPRPSTRYEGREVTSGECSASIAAGILVNHTSYPGHRPRVLHLERPG